MKKLVTYFSASGVTEEVAVKIADVANADLFEIKPKELYTAADLNWRDKNSRSSIEQNANLRPEIASKIENLNQYDIIFVGFPIWWYVAPVIINTFLESYDFSGKTLIPFATSGGSSMGDTEKVLHELCSNDTNWKPGKILNRGVSITSLMEWMKELKL